MARYRTDMNSIYISPRAQEALDPIAQCPLTTVVAPMGYGKTTAVQWFLDRRREAGDQVVRVSIYSNDLPLFWRSFQAAWRGTPLAGQLDPMAFPVGDTALGLLSERLLDLLDGAGDYYLFLDDYHLMKDDQVTARERRSISSWRRGIRYCLPVRPFAWAGTCTRSPPGTWL